MHLKKIAIANWVTKGKKNINGHTSEWTSANIAFFKVLFLGHFLLFKSDDAGLLANISKFVNYIKLAKRITEQDISVPK